MRTKLNAGSGLKRKRGYVNLDIVPECKPDIIADLNLKLPFKDESFEEILVDNVLEHIENIIHCMNEFHRTIKGGGLLYVIVPQFPTWGAIADPSHKHYFIPQSFGYFMDKTKCPGAKMWKPYKNTETFETQSNLSNRGNETLFIHMKMEKA